MVVVVVVAAAAAVVVVVGLVNFVVAVVVVNDEGQLQKTICCYCAVFTRTTVAGPVIMLL